MDCAEFESILADYVDGTLGTPERVTLERHAQACVSCGQFMADVTGAAALLERVADVEPPPDLITRIAYQAPRGKTREDLDSFGSWSQWKAKWLQSILQPMLQPRLVMGMAMTVLSFSMLARCTGVPVQHLQASDLNPGSIVGSLEDRVLRTRDRLVKNYDNLRVVYEIEARLNEMESQNSGADQGKRQDQGKGKK